MAHVSNIQSLTGSPSLQMMAAAGSFLEKQLRPIFEQADIDYGAIKVSTAVKYDEWSHCVPGNI